MQDSGNVIAAATKGIIDPLAKELDVSARRMYEMLGDQCVYPKSKRLIRAIAMHSQSGARLVKADLDAMFAEILTPNNTSRLSAVDLHREAYEAVSALLENKPFAVKKSELRELIAIAQLMLEGMDRQEAIRAV